MNPFKPEKNKLLTDIRSCVICAKHLPYPPKPVVNFARGSKILLVGQAPGLKVHESGIPWNDASGKRLREWLGVTSEVFYDARQFAIVPMGFCYPGKGTSGDLPPRPECARTWMAMVLKHCKEIQLKIIIGQYAMEYFLKDDFVGVTETIKKWDEFLPTIIPLPHPSPRNNIWLKKNPWFEKKLVPKLQKICTDVLKKNY